MTLTQLLKSSRQKNTLRKREREMGRDKEGLHGNGFIPVFGDVSYMIYYDAIDAHGQLTIYMGMVVVVLAPRGNHQISLSGNVSERKRGRGKGGRGGRGEHHHEQMNNGERDN